MIVDADDVARSVTSPGQPAHDAVLDRFGDRVRGPDGTLDRRALAAVVFADPAELAALEAIVHPAVRTPILDAIAAAERAGAPAVVVEAIKLVEGGLASLCDEVWLLTCDQASQRRRITGRGIPADDAERRIAAQGDIAERLRPAADRIIDTSADEAATRRAVTDAYAAALSL